MMIYKYQIVTLILIILQGYPDLNRIIYERGRITLIIAPNEKENNIKNALVKYSTMVYRICFMYLKNKSDAEDACQDVFLKYVQYNKQFENDEHEKAWICRVAFNRCKDILKSFNRKLLSLVCNSIMNNDL